MIENSMRSNKIQYNFYASLLTDLNVVDKLESAVKSDDPAEIFDCLKHITKPFNSTDLMVALQRYFFFYDKLKWDSLKQYRNNLHEAIYPFFKKDPNVIRVLQDCIKSKSPQTTCKILAELFFHVDDKEKSLMMLDIMHELKIACNYSTTLKFIPIFAEICTKEDLNNIKKYYETLNFIELNEEHSNFSSALENYLPKCPEIISNCLIGAFRTNNSELIFTCLRALYAQLYIGRNDNDRKIYEKISSFPFLEEEIARLILTLASDESKRDDFLTCQNIRSGLIFLSLVLPQEAFDSRFAEKLSAVTLNFFIRLASKLNIESATPFTRVLELINAFNLHEDLTVRKNLVEILAEHQDSYSYFSNVWLTFVQTSFPREGGINPVVSLIEEYVDQHQSHVFNLLKFGIGVKKIPIINGCLRAIEKHQLHAQFPLFLDCSFLLQRGENPEFSFEDNVLLFLTVGGSKLAFCLPRSILKARAPALERILFEREDSKSGEAFISLMKFIAQPGPLKNTSLADMASAYELADDVDCQAYKYYAEQNILKRTIEFSDVPSLLKLFKQAEGEFEQDLKYILLAQAFLISKTNPKEALSIIHAMQTLDPSIFSNLNMYQVVGRVVDPKKFNKDIRYTSSSKLELDFLRTLKMLVPKIDAIDLLHTYPETGALKLICDLYPDLKELSIKEHAKCEELKTLKVEKLKLYNPTWEAFLNLSEVPLTSLELYDFHYSDDHIEKLIVQQNFIPAFLSRLETLKFNFDFGHIGEHLSLKGASLLLPLTPNLKNLSLDVCHITPKILTLVNKHAPHLTSFSGRIYTEENSPIVLRSFLVFYPNLKELSLQLFNLNKESSLYPLIEMLAQLKSLTCFELPSHVDNASLKELAANHPDLVNLNLKNNKKLNDDCIDSLMGLNNLQELNIVGTNITFKGILRLQNHPSLRKVTFQLSSSWDTQDELMLLFALRSKGVDGIIEPRKN